MFDNLGIIASNLRGTTSAKRNIHRSISCINSEVDASACACQPATALSLPSVAQSEERGCGLKTAIFATQVFENVPLSNVEPLLDKLERLIL